MITSVVKIMEKGGNFSPRSKIVAKDYTGYDYQEFKKANRSKQSEDDEFYFIHFNKNTRYNDYIIRGENDMDTVHLLLNSFVYNDGGVSFPFASFSTSDGSDKIDVVENFAHRDFIIKAKCENAVAEELKDSFSPNEREVLLSGCNDFKINKIEFYKIKDGKKRKIDKDLVEDILKNTTNYQDFEEYKKHLSEVMGCKILITGVMAPNLEKLKEHEERYQKMETEELKSLKSKDKISSISKK